ncbi:MAG: RNA polymerase subunit sigma-70 [Flavobacteriales bacterium]|nr:MAG: RNA polymerase subunit sigma-70 [Flavobacteriales bacterium]
MKIIPFHTEEKQIIKKAAKSNRYAQKQLYEKYAPKMLSVCRQYIKDLQYAEDAMVKGFVKVFKHLKSYRGDGSFEGWIRKIMVRESINHLRKNQFIVYDDAVFENNNNIGVMPSSELDIAHIQTFIDDLPQGYKTVFMLYVVEGYKHSEIAQLLNISESTSKSQLFKARKILKEQLKKQKIIGYGTK